jgi:hypothetical protein
VAGPEDGPAVVLSGPPVECLLYLQGRRAASEVTVTGDPAALQRFEGANFAI